MTPDPQRRPCSFSAGPAAMPDPALERMQGAGMRAGICNAMPLAGVQAWVGYMREFERSHA